MPGAAERLVLFEADMYDAATFEPAIAGCEFVFLLATPLIHDPLSTKVTHARSAHCLELKKIKKKKEKERKVKFIMQHSGRYRCRGRV
jgi:hypothetical protein